jgi:two-component system, cell cycle sensor histidine kinase and response regulator CckA
MSTLVHILHLEDDPMDAELVHAQLKEANLACRITQVQDREEFEQMLRQNAPDIILADYQLPMFNGMAALQLANEGSPDIPFIFVSGTMGEDAAIEALTQGATDYILKHNLSRLPSAVQRALKEARNRLKHREAEEALALSEAKMRSILNSVDECFIVIDRNHRITSVNKAFCSKVKLKESQVIGKLCHEVLIHSQLPCSESQLDCPVEQTFKTGNRHSAFHTIRDESGNLSYLELNSYPITDASGDITSVIETINDVTEKRKLQEQLTQVQKMESIARLAGGVAHDFNNMLSVIMGRTELALIQTNPSQPLYADLKEIRSTAERSAALVRQLLAFARKQTVVPTVLNLNDTVEDILKMLRPLIGEAIDLAWRPAGALLLVKMDSSQIDQILVNLCVNASDAIAGVGKITIETELISIDSETGTQNPEFLPGDYVVLSVSDDGSGMERDTMRKIFEPFFTTKEVGRGTGLGLAMVHGIVKQNNGIINVYSEPGQGTVFKIYLPRHTPESSQPEQSDAAAPAPRGHEVILLVEDEPSILDMTRLMLEGLGYQVLPASLPGEAISIAKTNNGKIRLLLSDVIMPEMNGCDLAQRLRSLYPKIRCLFMSGFSGDIISHRGILDEDIHFIQKPFSLHNLSVKIRQILDSEDDK